MHRTSAIRPVIVFTTLVATTFAQSNIDPVRKRAWCENLGWTNWRDAGQPAAAEGTVIGASFLSGRVWSENTGWITLGNGSPANGANYANLDSSDFGVNVAQNGTLAGRAWSENTGWINFDAGASASPPQPARIDCSGRLNGFAWAENAGWLNLSATATGKFVAISPSAVPLRCDANLDGVKNGLDILAFVTTLVQGGGNWRVNCAGDVEPAPDGAIDLGDLPAFVACLLNP